VAGHGRAGPDVGRRVGDIGDGAVSHMVRAAVPNARLPQKTCASRSNSMCGD
jgi:hypothetical protein